MKPLCISPCLDLTGCWGHLALPEVELGDWTQEESRLGVWRTPGFATSTVATDQDIFPTWDIQEIRLKTLVHPTRGTTDNLTIVSCVPPSVQSLCHS